MSGIVRTTFTRPCFAYGIIWSLRQGEPLNIANRPSANAQCLGTALFHKVRAKCIEVAEMCVVGHKPKRRALLGLDRVQEQHRHLRHGHKSFDTDVCFEIYPRPILHLNCILYSSATAARHTRLRAGRIRRSSECQLLSPGN